MQVRLVDEDGDPVGVDEIGTLELQCGSLFGGYWGGNTGNHEMRADGWFTTRDRFMVDREGFYHHCGRVDDLFKVGGKWVSPAEVERALVAHEAVWEAAGIGAEDEEGLMKPLAFVVTNGGRMEDYWGFGKAPLPMLPAIAAPTTAGTGSDAQSYALIEASEPEPGMRHGRKMACGDRKARFRVVLTTGN